MSQRIDDAHSVYGRSLADAVLPQRLLVRPRPIMASPDSPYEQRQEGLGGWLMRLAAANGFEGYRRMLKRLQPGQNSLTLLEHATGPTPVIDLLSAMTDVPVADIVALSHTRARAELGVRSWVNIPRWVLRATLGGNVSYATVVCPICLASDETPYWRGDWRLSTTVVCFRHGDSLIERCANCGRMLQLSGMCREEPTRCPICGRSLCDEVRPSASMEGLPKWAAIPPDAIEPSDLPIAVAHPALWWEGLHFLLRILTSRVRAKRLLESGIPQAFQPVLSVVANANSAQFERRPLLERRQLLGLVDWLLQEWPKQFVNTMTAAKVGCWDFDCIEGTMPAWLDSVVKQHLSGRHYVPTAREAKEAAAVLNRDGRRASRVAIKRLLGVTQSQALESLFPPKQRHLSGEQLLAIVEAIDRRIALAPKKRHHEGSLLRNACCIAIAIWSGSGFDLPVDLPLSTGQALLDEWRDVTGDSASDRDDVAMARRFAAWMARYLAEGRAGLLGWQPDGGQLFITRHGEGYKGFATSTLFADVLRSCNVDDWDRGARLLVNLPPRSRPFQRAG